MNFNKSRLFLLLIAATIGLLPNIVLPAAAPHEVSVGDQKHNFNADDHKRHLNLVIMLEDGSNENPSNSKYAMTASFSTALEEESSPILATGPLVYNFLSRNAQAKTTYNARYEQEKQICEQEELEYAQNCSYENLMKAIQTILPINLATLTDKQIQEIEKIIEIEKVIAEKESEILNPKYKKKIEEIKTNITKIKNYYEKLLHLYNPDEFVMESSTELLSITSITLDIQRAINCIKETITLEFCNLRLIALAKSNIIDDLNYTEQTTYYCGLHEFTFENWLIFKHPHDNIYLFIPKEYKISIEQTWSDIITQKKIDPSTIQELLTTTIEEFISGFALTRLQKIETHEELMRLLNTSKQEKTKKKSFLGRPRTINISALQDFFIKKSENAIDSELMGYWNIALYGHGHASTDIQFIAQDVALQTNTKKKEILNLSSTLLNSYASICNLQLPQMKDFLTFLYHAVNTHSLLMVSCYIGGYHSHKIAQWLTQLEQNNDILGNSYTIIIEGLPEMSSIANCIYFSGLKKNETIKIYKNYFNSLQSIQLSPKTENLEQLKKAVKNIINENCIENTPFIRFPRAQWICLPLDGVTLIDHNTEIKNEQIMINNQEVILLQTNVIPTPILIDINYNTLPHFPILMPGLIGNQQYQFNKIELSMLDDKEDPGIESPISLAQFLGDSIYSQRADQVCIYTTTMHIDQLICKNYNYSGISTSLDDEILELTDVRITIAPTKKIFLPANAAQITGSISFKMHDGQRFEGTWNHAKKTVDEWYPVDEFSHYYKQVKKENMTMALTLGSLYLLSFAMSRP